MEENKKSETGSLTKRHFAKFNERIQNKYSQMQRRIEKSKSMESISSLGEDFVSDRRRSSVLSVSKDKDDEVFEQVKNDKNSCIKYNIIIEDVNKQSAIYETCETPILYEAEVTPAVQDDNEGSFFDRDFNLSLDNVHEAAKVNGELSATPSPKPARRKLFSIDRKKEKEKKKESKRKKSDRDSMDKHDKLVLSNKPVLDVSKKKNKVASVSIALIEATGPENEAAPDEKARQIYCRVRLGHEKHKSKPAKINGNTVKWQELYKLSLFEDYFLELTMWEKEKDAFIGRTTVDLSELKHDKTHRMNLNLDEGDGMFKVFILVTVSGTAQTNNVDLYNSEKTQKEILLMKKNFSWLLLNDDFDSVGWLSLVVYGARGLSALDCYALFELDNSKVQTKTEHKTNDPNWMKMYTFTVRDVTSIIYVTVYDEKKEEIVGKVSIPLLQIKNGEKKWYALKDANSRERAKGHNPRILLEMNFMYHIVKSSLRVINPKEKILLETEPEFNRHRFGKNIARTKAVINWITGAFSILKTLFEWESRKLNVIALSAWLVFWWFYKAWMLPLLFLVPFFWYRPVDYHLNNWRPTFMKKDSAHRDSDNDSVITVKESRSTLFQKINSLQEMVTTVQNMIGKAASLGESVKNLFNFTVPFLSFIAIFAILVISFIMFLIPCRYIIMGWGVQKFLRKIIRPNRKPNNEILDLLSRVPDDETLLDCKELPLEDIEKDEIFTVTSRASS